MRLLAGSIALALVAFQHRTIIELAAGFHHALDHPAQEKRTNQRRIFRALRAKEIAQPFRIAPDPVPGR